MRNKTFSCCLRTSLISASGRLFALNGELQRCRYSAKITAALPLVAGGRKKNSGATASEKVAALLSSAAVPSSASGEIQPVRTGSIEPSHEILFDQRTASITV